MLTVDGDSDIFAGYGCTVLTVGACTPPSVIPAPSFLPLVSVGLGLLNRLRRRKR